MSLPAWKMIYLARRNPALAFEDFPQAWREHSALGKQCRNVQDKVLGVTQCVRTDPPPAGTSAAYDGLNLLRLRDRGVADDIWNDPETLRVMRPDEPRVFDRYVRDFTVVAREEVWHGGPQGAVWAVGAAVLAGFLRRGAGHDTEQAWAATARACQVATAALPANARLVGNRVEPARPEGYDFDAIVELWLPEPADAHAACAPGGWLEQVRTALGSAIDTEGSVWMATRVSHCRP